MTFDWSYSSTDVPGFDGMGYSVNGAFTLLSSADGESGSASVDLNAGDNFALITGTADGLFGAGVGTFSNLAGEGLLFTEGVLLDVTGPESGDQVEPGVYDVEICATDALSGADTCCTFTITVNEYNGPVNTSLACNDNVQVSVDQNCEAMIGADEILEGGPYMCYDDYIVEVEGVAGDVNGISVMLPAGLHQVTVTDPNTTNNCWGTILVEDKLPPMITCTDVTLPCTAPTDPAFVASPTGVLNVAGSSVAYAAGESVSTVINVNGAPDGAVITDVNVLLDATDANTVSFTLTSPAGAEVIMVTDLLLGPCGVAPLNVTIDDDGANIAFCGEQDAAGAPITFTNFLGHTANALLNGSTQVDGEWTLTINSTGGTAGTLNAWAVEIVYDVALAIAPTASDNCDNNVELSFTDAESGDECEASVIMRTWTATDDAGNTATCVQTITITPATLDLLQGPANYEGDCNDSTDPSNTGWPTLDGVELTDDNPVCNIFVEYWDKPINDPTCANGSKILRTFTVLDWCTQTVVELPQIIKLSDTEGPNLVCPADLQVNTDFWYCYANVSLPAPSASDACGGAITFSVSSPAGIVAQFGNNFVVNELPIGTHVITYTATDACGNSSTCDFEITVVDNVPPVPNCDEHTIVSLTNDGPRGLTLVPATTFDDGSYDNCSDVTFLARRMTSCIDYDWTTNGACIDDAPNGTVNSRDRGTVHRPCIPVACCDVGAGPIMVELQVTDGSGNVNFCMVEVEVQDKLAPFIVCPPNIEVSCDFWFDSDVPLNQFVPVEEGGLDVFGTVIDAFEVNDNEAARQPIIINDPGNDELPQPFNWGLDGWADDNCDLDIEVRTRILDDCSGDDLPNGAPNNAVRYIERTFRAQDAQGNLSTCRQIIWVVDYDPFFITDQTCFNANPNDGVIWPCDQTITECVDTVPVTPPTIFDDNCSLIGVAYDDTRFDFVDGACFKILREWTVIDWCQYDVQTGAGIWKYTQVIKVIDSEGPEFQDCPDGPVTLCVLDEGVSLPDNNQVFLGEENPNSTSCSVHVEATKTVTEFCSDFIIYDVKVYPFNGPSFVQLQNKTELPVGDDGTVVMSVNTRTAPVLAIRRNGLPYNSPFCGDFHRVLWTVEDGCGNISTCEYLLRLEDCKQPTPVCINGLSTVVMPSDGTVTIWAKEYNVSSIDDCTPSENLLYSFSGDTYQPSMEFNCDNVAAFGAELSLPIWVADEGVDHNCNGQISWGERNKDFCTTTIVITDNDDTCIDGGSAQTAGDIMVHSIAEGVELTTVTASVPGEVFNKVAMTNDEGHYNLILPINSEYEMTPERNDDHKNGVSTLDLVRIQKHLLGVQPFDNPFDYIAADANNNMDVSALDLVELRKLILGIYTELPNNKSWRFVDASTEFADPSNPFPFDEVANVANLTSDDMDNHFEAVKVGDVNNTVVANATQIVTRNANGVFNMITDDKAVVAGETVQVTFGAKDFNTLVGYQFTMNAKGLELNDVKGAATDVTSQNIGIVDGQITASWHKIKGVRVAADDALFTFEFVATQSGRLSQMLSINSDVTDAEAYSNDEDIMNVNLVFRGAENADFSLYQNEPNPFNGKTFVGFDLPEAGAATMTVFDVTGKVLTVIDGDYAKGFNRVELDSKDLSATGLMYYRLDAGEYTATKKMVVIK